MREGVGAEREGKPSWVYVDWEPVASEAEARTICEVSREQPEWSIDSFDPDRYNRVEQALRKFGRTFADDFAPMWSRKSHVLTHPMSGTAVHDEVYKQLESEIVAQLMRDKAGPAGG
jgi:hypothetical protein